MNHTTYDMLAPAIISTLACCRRTTPYITAAEQQASRRTLRGQRTMYSHTGQYDHTLSKKQSPKMLHIHHTLKVLLRRFPCGCILNTMIDIFIIA